MADPNDPQANGEEAYAYFLTTGLPHLITNLAELQGFATDRGLIAFSEGVGKLLSSLLDAINQTAVQMAALADGYIIARIFETHTAKRPITGSLESHIRSEPGPLGSVRVGILSELDKAVNPEGGYGPFWRAQEFGTGTDTGDDRFDAIPEQAGRVLYGTFETSGTPPDAAQRGLNVGRDLAFVPGGANPGWGTINVELPGRHFLRSGSEAAGAKYIAAMKEIQDRYRAELQALLDRTIASSGGGRTFSGRIQA